MSIATVATLRHMEEHCPFCEVSDERVLDREGPCAAIADGYPVSEGHTLIIPLRHVSSFQDMSPDEWQAAFQLIRRRTAALQKEDSSVAGFNIGINDGAEAGQTIFHAHIHVIPRRKGDVPNPRGGVRHIIPCKGNYPVEKD